MDIKEMARVIAEYVDGVATSVVYRELGNHCWQKNRIEKFGIGDYELRDGRFAKVCVIGVGKQPLRGFIKAGDNWGYHSWTEDGLSCPGEESGNDLLKRLE